MLNDIKEHLRGSDERETKLLKKQVELKEKVILCFIEFCSNFSLTFLWRKVARR